MIRTEGAEAIQSPYNWPCNMRQLGTFGFLATQMLLRGRELRFERDGETLMIVNIPTLATHTGRESRSGRTHPSPWWRWKRSKSVTLISGRVNG